MIWHTYQLPSRTSIHSNTTLCGPRSWWPIWPTGISLDHFQSRVKRGGRNTASWTVFCLKVRTTNYRKYNNMNKYLTKIIMWFYKDPISRNYPQPQLTWIKLNIGQRKYETVYIRLDVVLRKFDLFSFSTKVTQFQAKYISVVSRHRIYTISRLFLSVFNGGSVLFLTIMLQVELVTFECSL